MSDAAPPPETPEIVEPEQATVSDPAKLIRLGTMVQTLMAEADQLGRVRHLSLIHI